MSISQPSREIYIIDVPEIKRFEATFRYNFFVPDESVNETGGIPSNILTRKAAEVDAHFIQYSVTRAPRFVEFNWTKPRIADVGGELGERALRDHAFRTTGAQNGSLIAKNINKIVFEDDFATQNFSSVHFHDGEIEDKIHELVSGTIEMHMLNEEKPANNSPYKNAQAFSTLLPSYIKPHVIYKAMASAKQAYGASFYMKSGDPEAPNVKDTGGLAGPLSGVTRVFDNFFKRLHHVSVNTQINSRYMYDLVNRTIASPTATNAHDLTGLHQQSKGLKQAMGGKLSTALAESDYKTFVPFIQAKRHGTASHAEKYGSELVGYIIDKYEVLEDGQTRTLPPIIVENSHVHTTADYQIKFNTRYCYTIRSIAMMTMPAIDDETGDVATIKVLVSSKPSNKIYVHTLNLDPPPPPADVNFVWDYERNRLLVTWAFPPNSQRDIKMFQVFRRSSINHCFELQKAYDFDDSVIKFPPTEVVDPSLLERVRSPATFWIDDEFNWEVHTSREKSFIYALACVDAHATTSNYGAQYRIWFDRFKNQIQKELVSHSGAPKPYPNLYLEGHLFENTIRVGGPHSRRMKLYFNPEYYYLTDDRNRQVKVLQTKQTGGAYKLQFINVDNLKAATLDIEIDDRTLISTRRLAYPTVRFGGKKPTTGNHSR